MPLKNNVRFWLLPFSLLPNCHEVSSYSAMGSCHDVWCHHSPKENESKQPCNETSVTMSQNKLFFLLSCLLQVFVTVTKT
jgi:hypothetical protein